MLCCVAYHHDPASLNPNSPPLRYRNSTPNSPLIRRGQRAFWHSQGARFLCLEENNNEQCTV